MVRRDRERFPLRPKVPELRPYGRHRTARGRCGSLHFESYMPSQAVRSPPAQKWHCTARSPRSGPPSAASSICRETTTLLRSTLILAAMLVASLTSASIAACAKYSEHEKSYTRAPMRARSIAPRIEFGAAGRSRSAAQICRSRWCGCSRSRSLRAPHPQR